MNRSLLLAVLLGACHSSPAPTPVAPSATPVAPTSPPSASGAMAEAKELFATKCAICHGPAGGGDGPAAGSLDPRPHDYRLAAWQASVSDAELAKIIIEGGEALGKSASMPATPYLAERPELVTALVAVIRGFAQPPAP